MRPVSPERTDWRDQALSNRHRLWGYDLPAADLDFLLTEYHLGVPKMVVEYKKEGAKYVSFNHPNYKAIQALCDGFLTEDFGGLPFVQVVYNPLSWTFKIYPINTAGDKAYEKFVGGECGRVLNESEFLEFLYLVRGCEINNPEVEKQLEKFKNKISGQKKLLEVWS